MSESWWEYVQRVSSHAPNKDIAATIQADASTITRWKQGDKPRAETVVAFARGYNRPAIEALIAAGYITHDDLPQGSVQIQSSISEISDSDLVAEMLRRLANNDPRRIDPGSPDDVFPNFRDDTNGRAWGR